MNLSLNSPKFEEGAWIGFRFSKEDGIYEIDLMEAVGPDDFTIRVLPSTHPKYLLASSKARPSKRARRREEEDEVGKLTRLMAENLIVDTDNLFIDGEKPGVEALTLFLTRFQSVFIAIAGFASNPANFGLGAADDIAGKSQES